MVSREAIFKLIFLLLLLFLVFDKLNSLTLPHQSTRSAPEESPKHLIHNAAPTDTPPKHLTFWNALTPTLHLLTPHKTHQTSLSQPGDTSSSFLHKVQSWLKRAFSLFSISPPTHNPLSQPTSTSDQSEIETQALQNSKAYHNIHLNGTDVAYLNPFKPTQLQGVALLLHGCAQQASDWFHLPEHRHIAAQLVRKRLAIFAVTSSNRISGCWSTRFPHWQNQDVNRVISVTKQWLAEQKLPPQTPLYAIGISSGATMLSVLSTSSELPNIVSQALYISPGNQRAFRNATASYPHTLFVHVATDHHYASSSAIAAARNTLLKRRVGLVGELQLGRIHFGPLTVHEREPRISQELSRKIFAAAEVEKGDIEKAMRVGSDEDLNEMWGKREWRRALRQVMRVVNGFHEVSAVHADKVAEWLIKHGRRE